MLPKQPIPWLRRAKLQELKAESQRISEKYGSFLHPTTEFFEALEKYASSPPPILRKKDEPDDPIPMPFDPGHPDRPLSPATSSIQSRIEGMYAEMSASMYTGDNTV